MSSFTDKQFLDYAGLAAYDELIKNYIKAQNANDNASTAAEKARAEAEEAAIRQELISKTNDLSALIQANTDNITVINGTGEGSITKAVNDAVTDLVNGAPEALDTLKEIVDLMKSDEGGVATLTNTVATNAGNIASLQKDVSDLRGYVDAQDTTLYNSIGAIESAVIEMLFKTKITVSVGQNVAEAIAALTEDEVLVFTGDETIADDIVVPENAYIDANGATFSGTVTVPASSVIKDAIFTGKVTIA